MGFFDKIKQGLTKTKTKMDAQLTGIFAAYEPGDEEFFEDLEETLILADTGVETTTKAIAQLRKAIELKKLRTGAEVKKEFVQILTRILKVQDPMLLLTTQPSVVLVVGVNGVGKTTTIGKLAAQLKKEGNRVLLSAADTFRAAAADQLKEQLLAAGSAEIDGVSGSTITSDAVKKAAKSCFAQAKGEATVSSVQLPTGDETDWLGKEPDIDEAAITETVDTDILIVGAGNGGMFAAAYAAACKGQNRACT